MLSKSRGLEIENEQRKRLEMQYLGLRNQIANTIMSILGTLPQPVSPAITVT